MTDAFPPSAGLSPDTTELAPGECVFEFFRASGPGGQNVNKVETAVRLRFDVRNSPSLPEAVKVRLRRLAGNRMTDTGVLIIEAQRFRSQDRNREDAVKRLMTLLEKARQPPRRRIATKPTKASRERRLGEKKQRGQTKKGRRYTGERE